MCVGGGGNRGGKEKKDYELSELFPEEIWSIYVCKNRQPLGSPQTQNTDMQFPWECSHLRYFMSSRICMLYTLGRCKHPTKGSFRSA